MNDLTQPLEIKLKKWSDLLVGLLLVIGIGAYFLQSSSELRFDSEIFILGLLFLFGCYMLYSWTSKILSKTPAVIIDERGILVNDRTGASFDRLEWNEIRSYELVTLSKREFYKIYTKKSDEEFEMLYLKHLDVDKNDIDRYLKHYVI